MNDLEKAHYSRQLQCDKCPSDRHLKHWKYLKKERVNGKWKYWYDTESAKNDAKSAVKETTSKIESAVSGVKDKFVETKNEVQSKVTETKDKIESTVIDTKEKAEAVLKDVKDALDPNKNKYMVNSWNYNDKIKEIRQDPEWKDIVKREDPEYKRVDPETGRVTYDIDSYLVNKKHPYLDAINDFAAGRKVSTLKIDADTTVAMLADHVTSKISLLVTATTALSRLLTESFKLQQGSYDDEIENASKQAAKIRSDIETGYKLSSNAASTIKRDIETQYKTTSNTASTIKQDVTQNSSSIIDAISTSAEGRELIDAGGKYIDELLKSTR